MTQKMPIEIEWGPKQDRTPWFSLHG